MCSVGENVQDRSNFFADEVLVVFSHEELPCTGQVKTWELWTEQPGKLRAMVVRPVPGSSTDFIIVGLNDITITSAMTHQKITYTVPSDERITAERGDMIAISNFGSPNNPALQANTGGGIILKFVFLDPLTLSPGDNLTTLYIQEVTASVSVNVVTESPGKFVKNSNNTIWKEKSISIKATVFLKRR